jgi:hypothetical protein
MFVPTGNGIYNATKPYNGTMNYGDSHLGLDLTNGVPTIVDEFTNRLQATDNQTDRDVGSGGILILPTQTSGPYPNLLVQAGKAGTIFLLNRDNLGGYNTTADQIVQELPNAVGSTGVLSSPAYWNGNVYYFGLNDNLKSFALVNGLLSTTPTKSTEQYAFPGATPSISANGATQGIVWSINSSAYYSNGPAILRAHDASNVATTLYSSSTNAARDAAGPAVKFTVPTIVNGKVYVGTANQLDAYGLLSSATQTSVPTFSPGSESFSGSVIVTISDATPNASIYYTTDGTSPSASSTVYTGPISVTSTETIKAIATSGGLLPSAQASATYTLVQTAATPTFSPAAGTYSSAQSVTISDATAGATIYYTTDGSTPTTASAVYSSPITVNATTTLKAIATASGYSASAVASATYTIQQPTAATPTFSPAAGTYSSAQSVTISDATAGATIYYTTNGSTPTTASAVYSGPITVSATTTLKAIATASGYSASAVASATYTISAAGTSINFGSGFASGGMIFNGAAKLNGSRLRITDGGTNTNEATSAWYNTQVNISTFTNDFSFQLTPGTNPIADGFTFVIQNSATTAVGGLGAGLGYGPNGSADPAHILNSVAIKFDLYDNAGEGPNSTGIYTNGASPTTPFVNLTNTGIDLHSGHIFNVHMTYNGTNLVMTITDTTTSASFTQTWPINLSTYLGGSTAYLGFTGGTGYFTAIQEIISWTVGP